MNPFEKHNIQHLSPSSLRLYRDQPAAWVVKYLFAVKDEAGPAAWRGLAVEAGLDHLLFGGNAQAALAVTERAFEEKAQGLADDKTVKERSALKDFLTQAADVAARHGQPLFRQKRVQISLDGIEVPLIGFIDYEWPAYGIDLKTTMRLPSVPSPAHVEQMSVYMRATGKPFWLSYVTPKRATTYEITQDMADAAWQRVAQGADAIRRMLTVSETAHDAARMFFPDLSSFYWSPPMIEKAQEIYG